MTGAQRKELVLAMDDDAIRELFRSSAASRGRDRSDS